MNRSITPLELSALWASYARFRKPHIAQSTLILDYAKISRRIEIMLETSPDLKTSLQIREWLLARYAKETARRTLVQFQAACRWALLNGNLDSNPFEGLTHYLTDRRRSPTAWAAFTLAERDAILKAFESEAPFYLNWPQFLFWTGCRPEEAAALRWRHIASDLSEILIYEAEPIEAGIVQATKNYRTTRFPCNSRLRFLLAGLRPWPLDPNERVFKGIKGGRFNYTNFQRRHWRPIVERLAAEGQIAFYLSQYHCRHTFITEACERMRLKDVSYLCRVSTTILLKHYMGRSRNLEIPEF